MNLPRLMRFGAVGVINTAIYFSCYLLLRMALPYVVAHICAIAIAMICSYFLNCFITFRAPPQWRTFLLFPLSNVANFVSITIGLPVAVEWFKIDERLAPLPVALAALPITYLVAHTVMVGRVRHSGAVVPFHTTVPAHIPSDDNPHRSEATDASRQSRQGR